MKNKLLYTSSVLLGSLMILMFIGATFGLAQTTTTPPQDAKTFVDQFCFDGKVSKMDVSDLVNVYTEKTNAYFNTQIAYIMTKPDEAVPNPNLEDYSKTGGGLCRDSNGQEISDMTCQSIAICNPETSDPATSPVAHPYCIGVTLLGVPPEKVTNYNYERLQKIEQLKYSYFCYKSALDQKRDALYDSTPQGILAKCTNGSEFADQKICDLKSKMDSEQDPKKKAQLESDLAYELNQMGWWSTSYRSAGTSLTANLIDFNDSTPKKVKFIDEEIKRAKQAMDQTLDAYSQLKSAWQMHVRYMDIFAELVKYRDHLVEIRKQTDAFPFRFIDATSTKCL